MTYHTRYNLRRTMRARANSLPSPQAPLRGESPLTPAPPSLNEARPSTPDTAMRTYSDVVRGNRKSMSAPSGVNDDSNLPIERGSLETSTTHPLAARVENPRANNNNKHVSEHINDNVPEMIVADKNLTKVESDSDGDDHCDWTTVRRKDRRGRLSEAGSRAAQRADKALRPEQEKVVREAEKHLSPMDRALINKRILTVTKAPYARPKTSESTTSREEGPSNLTKGKGPDPRNWGAVSASSEEVNLEAQRAALASWKAAQELARASADSYGGSDVVTHLAGSSGVAEPGSSQLELPTIGNKPVNSDKSVKMKTKSRKEKVKIKDKKGKSS
jgi:hypothetical protein